MVKSEKEKMLAGELYRSTDPELSADRARVRKICHALFQLDADEVPGRKATLLAQLFNGQTDVELTPPFSCDYGYNITLGNNVFFNFNCVVLDVTSVTIGNNVLIGPAVQLYTATHPIDAEERRSGLEFGKPISIGDDVWLGGASIVCPGVTIGSRSVIGAGSVVVKDIPEAVFAAGNPCRVIGAI